MEDFKNLFRENAERILSDFKRDFCFLKSEPDQLRMLKNIHRYAHSMKGLSAIMKLGDIYSISERLEGALREIINGSLDLNENRLLEIENGFNRIEKLLRDAE